MQCRIPPDHIVHSDQVALSSTPYSIPPAVFDPIWKQAGIDGRGITIINLDSGWVKHPDLPEPTDGKNFTGGASSNITDGNGHGTHTIGTHSGRNGIGVAPGSSIKVGKVLDSGGFGSNTNAGLDWAASIPGDIVSCSWGGGSQTDQATRRSLIRVIESGKILVFAAGNSGPGQNTVISPASSGIPLAVGATDENDELGSFSSTGPEVDIAAPGVRIISANFRGGRVANSGTSMACPYIAGAFALILQARRTMGFGDLDHVGMMSFLASEEFLKDAGPVGRDTRFGEGIITFKNMVNWLSKIATKLICLFVLCSLLATANGQSVMEALQSRSAPATVEVEPVRAFAADANRIAVEQAGEKTVVFVTEDVQIENGVLLSVSTKFKNSRIKLIRSEFDEQDLPKLASGKYVLIDKPGKFGVRVGLWDEELGFDWLTVPITIGNPPDDGKDPPTADFQQLKLLARIEAEKIGDKPTATSLAQALESLELSGLTLEAAIAKVRANRAQVLLDRPPPRKDWSRWLSAIDLELARLALVESGSYAVAIKAIAEGLRTSLATVITPVDLSKRVPNENQSPATTLSPIVRRSSGPWLDSSIGPWKTATLIQHLQGELGFSQHSGQVPAEQLAGRTLDELLAIHGNLHSGWSWDGLTDQSIDLTGQLRVASQQTLLDKWTASDCPGGVCPTGRMADRPRIFRFRRR